MRYLLHLKNSGVAFHSVEFPDYGAEGFFSVRAKKAGLLDIHAAVRLHSPNFMLFHDNRRALSDYTDTVVEMSAFELGALRDADTILYGADAMRDHVFAIASEDYGVVLDNSKATKLPHPWPGRKTSQSALSSLVRNDRTFSHAKRNVGLIGRLEPRKGCVRFARLLSTAVVEGRYDASQLKLHFFGADTEAPGVPSVKKVVGDLLTAAGIEAHFWGRLDQVVLWEAVRGCDALIFPSLFENYPNALLEALQFDMPVLVSSQGGMPEISLPFKNASSYNSENLTELTEFLDALNKRPKVTNNAVVMPSQRYEKVASDQNGMISQYLAKLPKHQTSSAAMKLVQARTCSVVIPHFRDLPHLKECIESVLYQLQPQDEIIVVDDCSGTEYDQALRDFEGWFTGLCLQKSVSGKVFRRPTNGGPGAARNDGASNSANDYLIFVDCDDKLAPGAVGRMRYYLDANEDVDAAAGIMKAFGVENHYWCPKDGIKDLVLFKNVSHCGIIIRKQVFLDVLYGEDRLPHYEDWEFMMRLVLSGRRFEAIPFVTYFYRMLATLTRNRSNAHYADYSRSQIIQNTLRFVSKKEIPVSTFLLGRLVGHASNLDKNILHPDVSAVAKDLPRMVAVPKSTTVPFDGLLAIDMARVEDGKFVITGWLGVKSERVSFMAARGERRIPLEHIVMERVDVVSHLKAIGSPFSAYGFQISLSIADVQWLGDDGVIYVRIGDDLMELDRVQKFAERALN